MVASQRKLKLELWYDPDIPFLDMYQKDSKSISHRDTTNIPVVIVALFTISRKWSQLRYISTDEWAKEMWYTYMMVLYLINKK